MVDRPKCAARRSRAPPPLHFHSHAHTLTRWRLLGVAGVPVAWLDAAGQAAGKKLTVSDRVVVINGRDTRGMTADEATALIKSRDTAELTLEQTDTFGFGFGFGQGYANVNTPWNESVRYRCLNARGGCLAPANVAPPVVHAMREITLLAGPHTWAWRWGGDINRRRLGSPHGLPVVLTVFQARPVGEHRLNQLAHRLHAPRPGEADPTSSLERVQPSVHLPPPGALASQCQMWLTRCPTHRC